MMVCITGTPGTGKSAVSEILRKKGYNVVLQNDTVKDYVISDDNKRDTAVIDEELWAENFQPFDGIIEGHLTHLLPCDLVVILRCRPDVLKKRLIKRGYAPEKVSENAMAEALDAALIETLECHPEERIFETDTTDITEEETAKLIEDFMLGIIPPSYGNTDWSEFLGADL
ncbi:MAG: adenylate kinase family protein [Methanomicrobiaceae archaeon]|nr:adenylate kinase family protein [Methanomicrobiaceae archaeon]